VLLGGS